MDGCEKDEVRDGVLALLCQHGFSSRVTDKLVGSIVAMLEEGVLPTHDQMTALLGVGVGGPPLPMTSADTDQIKSESWMEKDGIQPALSNDVLSQTPSSKVSIKGGTTPPKLIIQSECPASYCTNDIPKQEPSNDNICFTTDLKHQESTTAVNSQTLCDRRTSQPPAIACHILQVPATSSQDNGNDGSCHMQPIKKEDNFVHSLLDETNSGNSTMDDESDVKDYLSVADLNHQADGLTQLVCVSDSLEPPADLTAQPVDGLNSLNPLACLTSQSVSSQNIAKPPVDLIAQLIDSPNSLKPEIDLSAQPVHCPNSLKPTVYLTAQSVDSSNSLKCPVDLTTQSVNSSNSLYPELLNYSSTFKIKTDSPDLVSNSVDEIEDFTPLGGDDKNQNQTSKKLSIDDFSKSNPVKDRPLSRKCNVTKKPTSHARDGNVEWTNIGHVTVGASGRCLRSSRQYHKEKKSKSKAKETGPEYNGGGIAELSTPSENSQTNIEGSSLLRKRQKIEEEESSSKHSNSDPSPPTSENFNCKCKLCGKLFLFHIDAYIHVKDEHKKQNNINSYTVHLSRVEKALGSDTSTSTSPSAKKHFVFQCNVCRKIISSRSESAKRHAIAKHFGDWSVFEKVETISPRDMKLFTKEEKLRDFNGSQVIYKFKCSICDLCFDTQSGLTFHMVTHRTACTVCKVDFNHRLTLLYHCIETHRDMVRFCCKLCGQSGNSHEDMKTHMRTHVVNMNGGISGDTFASKENGQLHAQSSSRTDAPSGQDLASDGDVSSSNPSRSPLDGSAIREDSQVEAVKHSLCVASKPGGHGKSRGNAVLIDGNHPQNVESKESSRRDTGSKKSLSLCENPVAACQDTVGVGNQLREDLNTFGIGEALDFGANNQSKRQQNVTNTFSEKCVTVDDKHCDQSEKNVVGECTEPCENLDEIVSKYISTVCRRCGILFYSLHALNVHIVESHLMSKLKVIFQGDVLKLPDAGICKFCKQQFITKNCRLKHEKSHFAKEHYCNEYVCTTCGCKFYRDFELVSHKAVHYKSELYVCIQCRAHFPVRAQLVSHKKKAHGPKKKKGEKGVQVNFKCRPCAIVFSNRSEYRQHRVSHNKPLSCSVCQKSFKLMSLLKRHELGVHNLGTKDFLCGFCGKGFITQSDLNRHCLMVHCKEKHFKCKFCGKAYSSSRSLYVHVKVSHKEGSKVAVCELCGKTLKGFGSLQRHMRVHTGKKTHKCHLCGYEFNQGCSLKRHMKTHRGET